jgi:hypothetical protein
MVISSADNSRPLGLSHIEQDFAPSRNFSNSCSAAFSHDTGLVLRARPSPSVPSIVVISDNGLQQIHGPTGDAEAVLAGLMLVRLLFSCAKTVSELHLFEQWGCCLSESRFPRLL